MAAFLASRRAAGVDLPGVEAPDAFPSLHRWSIDHPGAFWAEE